MLYIESVAKSFMHQGEDRQVLRNISFEVEEGEFLCIVGPSGSGKTTLLRMIGGFEKVSQGRIIIEDEEITGPGIDRVMVFQGLDQLFAWKTVAANVEYPLKVNRVGAGERRARSAKYLDLVGLSDFADYYPHQLSGGMKQRAALARALALHPKVLLMDEPFGSLDAQTRSGLQEELSLLWQQLRTTILFVTHDIEEALLLADRLLVINHTGEMSPIMTNPLPRPRYPGMPDLAGLREQIYSELGGKPRASS